MVRSHARIQRWDRGSGSPLKNHKNIEFISNTGPDLLKFSRLPSQHSTIIGTPAKRHLNSFRWRADDGPLIVIFGFSPLKRKKNVVSVRIMEFRKECFVNLNIRACDRKHATHQYCRISDFVAHEKHLQVSFSAPVYGIFRDYKRFVCKR